MKASDKQRVWNAYNQPGTDAPDGFVSERYKKYVEFCNKLKIKPATYETWSKMNDGISETWERH